MKVKAIKSVYEQNPNPIFRFKITKNKEYKVLLIKTNGLISIVDDLGKRQGNCHPDMFLPHEKPRYRIWNIKIGFEQTEKRFYPIAYIGKDGDYFISQIGLNES